MAENIRCNFEVPSSLFNRMKRLPWGTRANLIRILLEKVCDSIEENGEVIIGAILSGEYQLVYAPKGTVQNLDKSTKGKKKK